jgi:RNA polymerase primary sigma factor
VTAGQKAHAELVCANLRLVVSIAKSKRYERSGVEFADRIQDGNLGLMRAADKFDGSKGFKFSTYATWWIRQSIERGIGDRGRLIRLPQYLHIVVQRVWRAETELTRRFGREPTLSELAEATGMDPGRIQWALDVSRPTVSLDAFVGEDGDVRLSDLLARTEDRDGRADPAEITMHTLLREDIARVLNTLLPERSVRVMERRYGLGTCVEETLEAIADDYRVTRERIRQIQSNALNLLRGRNLASTLRAYLVDESDAGWQSRHFWRTRL